MKTVFLCSQHCTFVCKDIYCTVLRSSLPCCPQKCDNEVPHCVQDVSAVAGTVHLGTDWTLQNTNSILSEYTDVFFPSFLLTFAYVSILENILISYIYFSSWGPLKAFANFDLFLPQTYVSHSKLLDSTYKEVSCPGFYKIVLFNAFITAQPTDLPFRKMPLG